MPEVDKRFELRQLLKAYRKGLISDELFEEQLAEISGGEGRAAAPSPGKVYRVRERTFATERAMLLHFLDEFRAGETFGGEVFAAWHGVATDPRVRGGLAVVREREAMHGRLLGERLAQLGGTEKASLAESFRSGARARLAARDVTDAAKVADFNRRLPDAEKAVAPIREVIAQIEEDCESRALLEAIVEDELATVRWFHAVARPLGGAGADSPATARGNGSAAGVAGATDAGKMRGGSL